VSEGDPSLSREIEDNSMPIILIVYVKLFLNLRPREGVGIDFGTFVA